MSAPWTCIYCGNDLPTSERAESAFGQVFHPVCFQAWQQAGMPALVNRKVREGMVKAVAARKSLETQIAELQRAQKRAGEQFVNAEQGRQRAVATVIARERELMDAENRIRDLERQVETANAIAAKAVDDLRRATVPVVRDGVDAEDPTAVRFALLDLDR